MYSITFGYQPLTTKHSCYRMKKILLVVFAFIACYANAQFINQLQFIRSYTPQEINQVFVSQGLPSGVLPVLYGAKAYKVIYNTVGGDSSATIASGLVILPIAAPCKVGIISYQHGTTLKKVDVPSNQRGEWFIALAAAAQGYIGVMPDYLGMGESPGMHPYQHAHTEATATIDLIRAAKQLGDTAGAPANDQLFLMGYSQGGHATMAAHQLIQEKLDDVMHVTASAPMSGAYDMSGVMSEIMLSDDPYSNPFYLPYLFFGYNSVYHLFNSPSDIMVSPYDTLLPPMFDGTYSNGQVDAVMPNVPKLIMRQEHIDSFANDPNNFFRVRLRENNTYNWLPTSPIKMYFCRADEQVNYRNTNVAYHKFLENGMDPSMIDTVQVSTTLSHYDCAQFAILGGVNWFKTLAYTTLEGSTSHTDASSANATDGTATVTPTGGNAAYSFAWSNGATTQTATGLGTGKYYITVTDESLCTYTDSVTISAATGIEDIMLSDVRIYPNPAKGNITIQASEALSEVKLYNLAGQQIQTYTVTDGNKTQLLVADYTDGIYYIKAKSVTGKQVYRRIVLQNE